MEKKFQKEMRGGRGGGGGLSFPYVKRDAQEGRGT